MSEPDSLADLAAILGLPVAVIAILVSVWLWRRGRQRRALSCLFAPIVSPVEIRAGVGLEGDLAISYKGQPVDNIFLVRALLRNDGNHPIRKSDVVRPITFTFPSSSEFLREPRVLDVRPSNLESAWILGEPGRRAALNAAYLDFELLNPGDEVLTEFACTGTAGLPKVTARVEGVSVVEILEPQDDADRRLLPRSDLCQTRSPVC